MRFIVALTLPRTLSLGDEPQILPVSPWEYSPTHTAAPKQFSTGFRIITRESMLTSIRFNGGSLLQRAYYSIFFKFMVLMEFVILWSSFEDNFAKAVKAFVKPHMLFRPFTLPASIGNT